MKKNKPKIRKYNKKLKKIEDEESIFNLEEELLFKKEIKDKLVRKINKW